MGKIILSERQYRLLKNNLVENVIGSYNQKKLIMEGNGTINSPFTDAQIQVDVDTVVDDIDGWTQEYNVRSVLAILKKYYGTNGQDKVGMDDSNPTQTVKVPACRRFLYLYKLDEGTDLLTDLNDERAQVTTFSNEGIKNLDKCIWYVKNCPQKLTTTTPSSTPGSSGSLPSKGNDQNWGGTGKDPNYYWNGLFGVLKSAGLNPQKNTNQNGPYFQFSANGNFGVIFKNYLINGGYPIYLNTKNGRLFFKFSGNNGKYIGQPINKITLQQKDGGTLNLKDIGKAVAKSADAGNQQIQQLQQQVQQLQQKQQKQQVVGGGGAPKSSGGGSEFDDYI